MQLDIEINRGVLLTDNDATGFNAMVGYYEVDTFFNIGDHEKNYKNAENFPEESK